MKYKIILGDWPDDGHGKTETFIIQVRDGFNRPMMIEAYLKARADIGFGPEDLCEGYEESSYPRDMHDKMLAAGFKPLIGDDSFEEEEFAEKSDSVHPGNKGMVQIIMFYLGYQLENFGWYGIDDDIPLLVGGYGAPILSTGYGLFYA